MIAWVDLETTGLEPREGYVLEVAIVITDDNLEELGSYVSPVFQDPKEICRVMDATVRKMHTDNGLLDVIEDAPTLAQVEDSAMNILRICSAYERASVKPPLGGSTTNFDRAWLAYHMPQLHSVLHYRNIDVSTLYELNARWNFAPVFIKNDYHRAADDIQQSIKELYHYRQYLRRKT